MHQSAPTSTGQSPVLTARGFTDEQAAQALQSRTVIGQAIGIVMVREQLDSDRAYEHLVELSQRSNVKLREVARQLVADLDARHRGRV